MIDENDVATLLRAASEEVDVTTAPGRALADAGRRRVRRLRLAAGGATAAAVAVAAVGVPVALGQDRSDRPDASADPTSCVDPVPTRVLPPWARTGFTDPRPRMPYVLGDNGDIVAIVFAQPLTSPPSADHNNKILWVARVPDHTPLQITATLADGSLTVVREVPGSLGPSIIDLPEPGCWHLELAWADQTDSLSLAYRAPRTAAEST